VSESSKSWARLRQDAARRRARARRLAASCRSLADSSGHSLTSAKFVAANCAVELLEAILLPGDRVVLEGDNQKHADLLAQALGRVDPARVHDLHMVQPVVALPDHLELFARGIARRLDFSYCAGLSKELAGDVLAGRLQIGSIHTYLELYGRLFSDLAPRVALIAASAADADGNLFTGYHTEETPVLVEAAHFHEGLVVAQVDAVVARGALPRVDIPGDWVDFIIPAPAPHHVAPLFTRDPALINERQILIAMLALKGIYARYGVRSLNHGVGFHTAAVELLLPTYGEELGLKGEACTHWVLNPHPTLIPAIESGFVESVYCFGGEPGMEDYVAARPDVFAVGPEGVLRANRAFAQVAGHYAVDMFVGSTLQIDPEGNSSTVTLERIAGFGGAPNLGCDAPGRRHVSAAWRRVGEEDGQRAAAGETMPRGRKLVVLLGQTVNDKGYPLFVERLDAWAVAQRCGLPGPPIMLYGEDVTHIVTERGVAHLHRCRSLEERRAALRAVAGDTDVGRAARPAETETLRRQGVVERPADLEIDPRRATRALLAAQSLADLVRWSGGLYQPVGRLRS